MTVHVKHFEDIDYTVESTTHDGYFVEFKVYGLLWVDDEGPAWNKKDSLHSPNPVRTLSEAPVEVDGSVKWDGCSNWDFCDNGYHFCSRGGITKLGEVLARCWDWAAELMPEHWDGGED